jgi:hypothetical protein
MIIRRTKDTDIPIIRKLSLNLTVSRDSNNAVGFVDYITPTESELKQRNNDLFLVAEENEEVIGFITAYPKEMLKNNDFSKDEIVKHILKKQENFI